MFEQYYFTYLNIWKTKIFNLLDSTGQQTCKKILFCWGTQNNLQSRSFKIETGKNYGGILLNLASLLITFKHKQILLNLKNQKNSILFG